MRDVRKLLGSRSYQICALIDPRNDKVRYVGLSFDAYIRFYGHLKKMAMPRVPPVM